VINNEQSTTTEACSKLAESSGMHRGGEDWQMFSRMCAMALDDNAEIRMTMGCLCDGAAETHERVLREILARLECSVCRYACRAAGVDACPRMGALQLDGEWRETYVRRQ